MNTLKIYPENKKQLAALKSLFEAFNLSLEIEKSSYDPKFVEMIHQGKENLKVGKGIKVDIDDCGSSHLHLK